MVTDRGAENAAPAVPADPLLAEIVSRLVSALQPERIYLFGSRARGDAVAGSDYDVLLLVRERVGPGLDMERRASRALRGVDAPVDVLVMKVAYFERMRGAAATLAAAVAREGRLVYAA